jgi:hypothetical protein
MPPSLPARFTAGNPSRRLALLGLAAALAVSQLPACASEATTRYRPVDLAIVDRDSGRVLPIYRQGGRAYVAGQPGARYAIRVANRTGGRVMVVLSVDGVNVITGQTAAWHQTGYVLDPWRRYDIAGWRKSDTAIADFVFAASSDSYAARTGRPANVGVIGMAVFLEKSLDESVGRLALPQTFADATGKSSEPSAEPADAKAAANRAAPAGADRAAAAESFAQRSERLGTAHGDREWSVATRTSFERASDTPQSLVQIAYDSFANLVAAGVIALPIAQLKPFPLSEAEDGFVPDPPPR